jgi:hypothetical protein
MKGSAAERFKWVLVSAARSELERISKCYCALEEGSGPCYGCELVLAIEEIHAESGIRLQWNPPIWARDLKCRAVPAVNQQRT